MDENSLLDEEKLEMENQFILRLPEKSAEKIRSILQKKPKKIKKIMSIDLNVDKREGVVTVNKKRLKGDLVTLPTIVESNKCMDQVHLFKTADISQMLICKEENKHADDENCNKSSSVTTEKNKHKEYSHGITPPLKNVRQFRFRKTKINKNDVMQESDVEKEVLWLLRMDSAAVASRFEICNENTPKNSQESVCGELEIFGDVISDDSDQASSSETNNEIIEYIN